MRDAPTNQPSPELPVGAYVADPTTVPLRTTRDEKAVWTSPRNQSPLETRVMWCKTARGALAGLATLFVAQSFSSTAHAYCRSRTCPLGKTDQQIADQCTVDEEGCIIEGRVLRWESPCLRYAVQVDGSPLAGLDGDQAAELVEQAFALWRTAECPGGGNPRFEAGFQGFVTCHERETVCAGASGNVSVVMFHDEVWPYGDRELGVTHPTAGTESGVIHDADVEINAMEIVGAYEMFPVLAHEIGHYLGLTHSTAPSALMSASYQSLGLSGDLLSADDIAGICAVYPPSNNSLSCGTAPAPAYDTCANPEPLEECSLGVARQANNDGCSVAAVGSNRPRSPLIALGAVISLACLLRRKREVRKAGKRF
jgi:hypothetical protein